MDSSVPSTQSLREGYLDQVPSGLSTPAKELIDANEVDTPQCRPLTKRKLFWFILTLAFIVVVLAVVIPVVLLTRKKSDAESPSTTSGVDHGSSPPPPLPTGGPVST